MSKSTHPLPTAENYGDYQAAYDLINTRLFDGELPPCLITMQRKANTMGYFSHQRWASAKRDGQTADEIALNPQYFASHPIEETLSTLAHEMVHLWQAHFGEPGRRAYHNRQWADKMLEIGLTPSDTGQPGGKQTGEKMADYITPDGPFEGVVKELLAGGFVVPYTDRAFPAQSPANNNGAGTTAEGNTGGGDPIAAPKPPSKVKYRCEPCKVNAWAKPETRLICGECRGDMGAA